MVEIGDQFTGKVGWQPFLPKEMSSLDLAFCLGSGSKAEGDTVEVECLTQLGECLWVMGEEDAVVIDVEFQRQPILGKGTGQQIKVGQQRLPLIDFRCSENPTAIVDHVDHGEGLRTVREPAMGCCIQLPQLTNLTALPASHRSRRTVIRFGVGQTVLNSPATDLSSVELELAETKNFTGGKAVGSWRLATQAFA